MVRRPLVTFIAALACAAAARGAGASEPRTDAAPPPDRPPVVAFSLLLAPGARVLTGELADRLGPAATARMEVGFWFALPRGHWLEVPFGFDLANPERTGPVTFTRGERAGSPEDGHLDVVLGFGALRYHVPLGERWTIHPHVGLGGTSLSGDDHGSVERLTVLAGAGADLRVARLARHPRGGALDLVARLDLEWQHLNLGGAGPGLDGEAFAAIAGLQLRGSLPRLRDPPPPSAEAPQPPAPPAPRRPPEPGLLSGEVDPWTLSRDPLTLPRGILEFRFERFRLWPDGRWDGGSRLALGVGDRVDVALPLFFQVSLGDREARRTPEVALGGGLTSIGLSDVDGFLLGGGASASVRGRVGERAGWRAAIEGTASRWSDSGASSRTAVAWAGVTYDAASWLSLGFAVTARSDREDPGPREDALLVGGGPLPLARLFGLLDVHGGITLERGDVGGFAGLGVRLAM